MHINELLIHIVKAVQDNLILALPIILVTLRFIVIRIAGEPPHEFARNLFAVPLDLTYAAIGIILSALHKDFPGFERHFGEHTAGVGSLLVILLGVIALIYTVLNRLLDKLSKNFIIAMRDVQGGNHETNFSMVVSRCWHRWAGVLGVALPYWYNHLAWIRVADVIPRLAVHCR